MTTSTDMPALLAEAPPTAESEEWLGRVEEIVPVIESHRSRTERDRQSPPEVFEALRAAGIPRMWVSREFGGGQVSIETGAAVISRLAAVDASVAWQMGVQALPKCPVTRARITMRKTR
jgi:alkylation response protein AidB-like acyl-CoA dehydrogenase